MNRDSRSTMRTRCRWLVIALALSPLVADHPAYAQSSTYPPEVESNCKDDYFRYCSPYALGSDELRRCMEAKGVSLSSQCQQALKNAGYVKPDRLRRGS